MPQRCRGLAPRQLQRRRNAEGARITWMFTAERAREKREERASDK